MLRIPLLVVALVPLLSGCVAVAAAAVVGVGVVQYSRNEVLQDYPADLEDTHAAALEALRRLEHEPEKDTLSPTESSIESGDLLLAAERHPDGVTRVRVRIGTFHSRDHERRAELVLQEIGTVLDQRDELRAWAEKVRGAEPASEPQPAAQPAESQPEG
jgi:hypothetical protein